MMYVNSRVDALTTGVSLWQAKMVAVTMVTSKPMMDNVTAAMAFWSLHLMCSTGISTQPADQYNVISQLNKS